MGTPKNLFEIYRQFGHVPSNSFYSPRIGSPRIATEATDQPSIFFSFCSITLTFLRVKWFVSFRSAKNLADLADGPTLHVCLQGAGYVFVRSANSLSLSQCQELAPSLRLENSTGHRLYTMTQGNCVGLCTYHSHTRGTRLLALRCAIPVVYLNYKVR